jgi:hypothetical protein
VDAPRSSPIAVAWAQVKPADGDLLGWAAWLEKLALVYRQQASLEARVHVVETAARGYENRLESVELRLDAVEKAQSTLPELLALLKPEQLSPLHQTMVRRWVNDLAHLTGWHITMIFQDLVADFAYHSFSDARESDWERIAEWFRQRSAARHGAHMDALGSWVHRGRAEAWPETVRRRAQRLLAYFSGNNQGL